MIALAEITNTEIFSFTAILAFKLLFINRNDTRNLKSRIRFKRTVIFCKIINSWNARFSGYSETRKRSFTSAFSICIFYGATVPQAIFEFRRVGAIGKAHQKIMNENKGSLFRSTVLLYTLSHVI